MVRTIMVLGWILSCMLVNVCLAGTIYTWTDADGVKRYSNAQPPEGTENVKIIDEVQTGQDNGDQIRNDYNRMVEEASQEADRHFAEQAEKKAAAREAERQRQQEKGNEVLAQERQKLQQEIEALRNRGLSTTFSAGQKEYLIRQIEDKIRQIDDAQKAASSGNQ